MQNLPYDVLELIFQNLTPKELVNTSLVCKDFWNVITEYPSVWYEKRVNSNLTFLARYYPIHTVQTSTKGIEPDVLQQMTFVKDLHMRNCNCFHLTEMMVAQTDAVIRSLTQLESLNLRNFTGASNETIAQLDLKRFTPNGFLGFTAIQEMENLEFLDLNYNKRIGDQISILTNLTELHTGEMVTEECLSQMTQLRKLTLNYSFQNPITGLLLTTLTNLEYLDVRVPRASFILPKESMTVFTKLKMFRN